LHLTAAIYGRQEQVFGIGIETLQSQHLPTHRLDSIIENERTLIASYLVKCGAMLDTTFRVTTPRDVKNAACDPFWTDGRAVLLLMPPYRPVSP
jgi:hypothetical protein